MFIHSVYFWLTKPESADDRAALQAGLETLRGIGSVQAVSIGTPAETRRPVIDHSYDFALLLTFSDLASHDAYQVDPTHLAFVDNCKHLWSRVQIYDVVANQKQFFIPNDACLNELRQVFLLLMTAYDIAFAYYTAFNQKDWTKMLSLLSEDVRHDSNQGATRTGKAEFTRFLQHMDDCYDETLTELVILTEPTGTRVACEFVVNGTYQKTDGDLPEANGQTYVLPAGSFLDIANGQITRVTTYYNLPLWESLVRG